MNNSSKVALITGASQRIGAEISRELHQRGFNIIIHYCQSATQAQELANELNLRRKGSAHCVQANLTSMKDIENLAESAKAQYGGIDALINNASSFYPTAVSDATEADWNDLIDSNLKGPFFLSQALVESLSKRAGSIINIVDIHSERPMRNHSVYCIAKAGVAMMTKTLAKELAPTIRVNGVSPGAILWPEPEPNEKDKASILTKVPMQRIGDSSDIARTVAFLIEDAPYVSGQIIAVDGGRSLNM